MKIQEATHASRANAVVTYDANVAAIATLIHCARAGVWSDFGIRCCGRGAQRDEGQRPIIVAGQMRAYPGFVWTINALTVI